MEFYKDSSREHFIGNYEVNPGDVFSGDVSEIDTDAVSLKLVNKHRVIRLAGRGMVGIVDLFLDCFVTATTRRPVKPPY